MADYMESAPPAPPASYQASVEGRPKKELHARSDSHEEERPLKSAKHDDNAYADKSSDQYNTIDFLGNVSGGPHAAAAEALATFSSSVGENTNNANMFVHVPPAPSNVSHNNNTNTSTPHGPPFLCPTCNTSYSRLEYLRRHERRHADIRPFTCVCGKSFSRSDVLARHKTKCRVVLAGDSEAPADRKGERRTNAPRATRSRTSAMPARKSDRDEITDLSVDPALSNAVDLSMQPPPPLEGEVPHGEVDGESYSFSSGPPNYGHHNYGGHEGDHGTQVGKPGPYSAPNSGTHSIPHRQHESKMYSQHGAPTMRGSPYVSGAAAIHPELSSRNAYSHSGSHTPTGNNGTSSPNSNNSASSPYYAHTEAPSHASYSSSNLRESDGQVPAQSGGASSSSAPNSAPYPIGKEPTRYSVPASGPLSPFSNTALNSTMSPYLSAFSCARDIPHSSSSSRPSPSGNTSSNAPTSSAPNGGDASAPSESNS